MIRLVNLVPSGMSSWSLVMFRSIPRRQEMNDSGLEHLVHPLFHARMDDIASMKQVC